MWLLILKLSKEIQLNNLNIYNYFMDKAITAKKLVRFYKIFTQLGRKQADTLVLEFFSPFLLQFLSINP